MTKLLSAAALIAAIITPAIANAGRAAPEHTFTRDGETYVYTSTDQGGATLLVGRAYPSGRDFTLTVRGNRVNGYSGGVPVSFVVENRTISDAELAAR